MESRRLLTTLLVQRTADDLDPGSLRWAILQANLDNGGDSIGFDIDGGGVQTISLTSPLPAITAQVTIDGTTQPGYAGRPLIKIDGSGSGVASDGLVLQAGGNLVRGLAIGGFRGAGILIQGSDGNVIQGNYVGADPTGRTALPNQDGIRLVDASRNTIGGLTAGDGNLISGNLRNGLSLAISTSTSTANVIERNLVGTTADGNAALGNGSTGIVLSGASGNFVGGVLGVSGNVVSGNVLDGVLVNSGAAANLIQGNFIGTTADGRLGLGNLKDGIHLDGAGANTIGGADAGAGNVIGGNLGSGVEVFRGQGGVEILGNFIGTDASGKNPLGNAVNGVTLASGGNSVGGASEKSGNLIAFNGTGSLGAGVQLVGLVDRNSILSNSIHDNAGLGINLGNGPTPNHQPGMGQGPNDFQNYPLLSLARSDGGSMSVNGILDGVRSSTYLIQFFGSPTPDPSGFGEGTTLLSVMSVSTDSTGRSAFNLGFPSSARPGMVLSATATDSRGNTSEFSPAVQIQGVADLSVTIDASPSQVTPGQSLTYRVTVTNKSLVDAHGVMLQDSLPGGLSVLSVTAGPGVSVTRAGRSITADLGTLAAGSTATVTVVGTVTALPGTTLTSSASVTLAEPDPVPSNNVATSSTLVRAVSDVSLAVTSAPETVRLGDSFSITFLATNQGTTPANGVVLQIPVGPDFSYDSTTTTNGFASYDGGILTVNLGTLIGGSTATVTVVLDAADVGSGDIAGTLTTDDIDPTPDDHSAAVTVQVVPSSRLLLALSMPPGPSYQGSSLTYTVSVINNGPSDATGVVLALPMVPGLTPLSATSSLGDAPVLLPGLFEAAIGTIPNQATVTVTILVRLGLPIPSSPATLLLSAAVEADDFDPGPGGGSIMASVRVDPVADLAVELAVATPSPEVGKALTLVATVANNGPSDAAGAMFRLPVPTGASFVSADAGSRACSFDSGVLEVPLGLVPSGGAVSVLITLLASSFGPASWTASVSGPLFDPSTDNNASTATAEILNVPGTLALGTTAVTVAENAGSAVFPVYRTVGTLGTVSVHYWTGGGNAVPGVDYIPTTGTLTFAPGQTVANIVVPVLANPHDRGDEYVSLMLDSPAGGAILAGPTTASLHVVNIDPDLTPPQVADVHWFGSPSSIDRIEINFTEPLVASMAASPAAYMLADLGTSGRPAPGDARIIGLNTPSYDPTRSVVTLIPSQPLAAGHFYRILVAGSGPAGLMDLAGNALDGTATGPAGTNYVALFGRGTSLKYYDDSGNLVTLKVTRGGYLDLLRSATGEGLSLRLQGGVPGKSVLTGSVAKTRGRAARTTTLQDIEGLGQFGQIRVNMSASSFTVKQYPFLQKNGKALTKPVTTKVVSRTSLHAAASKPVKVIAGSSVKRG